MAKTKDTTKNFDKSKLIFSIAVGMIVILSLLLLISGTFGNFEKVRLSTNKKDIFTISDLTVNNVKFGDTSKVVKEELGKPSKEETKIINNYEYLILTYPGLELSLKQYYDDYILVKAEITSSKYTTSRNIKVGTRIVKAIKKYNISISEGNYIYKNYTMEALSENLVKDNVYFGIRNSKEVRYYNRDAVVEGKYTNTAKLILDYKKGKVSKITWSYDAE